jgi:hypothetical protein
LLRQVIKTLAPQSTQTWQEPRRNLLLLKNGREKLQKLSGKNDEEIPF